MASRKNETPFIKAIREKNLEKVANLLREQPSDYDCNDLIRKIRNIKYDK